MTGRPEDIVEQLTLGESPYCTDTVYVSLLRTTR
jgi:hypothetical protein